MITRRLYAGISEFLGSLEKQIEWQGKLTNKQRPPGAPDGDFVFHPSFLDRLDHEQVHIAVRSGLAVGIGTEKDDLLGMELLDEHLKVRKQLIGYAVDRVAGIPEYVLTDLRGMNRGSAHDWKIAGGQEMSSFGIAVIGEQGMQAESQRGMEIMPQAMRSADILSAGGLATFCRLCGMGGQDVRRPAAFRMKALLGDWRW